MEKSYIWSIPTRIFHWFFAIFILLAFITADEDRLLNYHAIIGYLIFILLIFRVFWGILGPKYSRFKDFPLKIKELKLFLSNIFNKDQKYIGHNPLASYVMVGMFIIVFLCIFTGVLSFGIQEGKGIFSFLNITMFKHMEVFKELHEIFTTLLIGLIVAHLGGVIFDKIFHGKYETLKSIFTGNKLNNKKEIIRLGFLQKVIAILFFVLFLGFIGFNFFKPKNVLISSIYKPLDYEKENALFVAECASCHTLYPPTLLPKKSWKILMSDLENHFGDDASLEDEENSNILSFLLKNSAETSSMEASKKILDSIENKDIISISQTSFWKKRHKQIPKKAFEHPKVKSKANCKACHLDIEKGLIEDENIKDISGFM